ncbi:MAG TPA: helix-turn-helix transcriptional regulator [Opitutales bacterium]|nr:helix-turn-helix transcriptional regulator [Opitutales bacterium]
MFSRELVAASARPLLLSILAEGENYGYALAQRARSLSQGEVQWTDGMLYPVLHRLEEEELIASEWRESETGRERKYYRLTQSGRRALAKEKAQWLAAHNTLAQLWNLPPILT